MTQNDQISKIFMVLFALVPCVVYVGVSIYQWRAAPDSAVFKYTWIPIGIAALASCVLLAGIYNGFISKSWEKIQQSYASDSTFKQSVIFRLFHALKVFGYLLCGIRIYGRPLFSDNGEALSILGMILTSVLCLLNGIVFAFICVYLKKKRLMIFPLFILYSVVATVTLQGLAYSNYLLYPSYCKDAAPGSTPSIVCNALGPDSAILVKADQAAYINFYEIFDRVLVPENDAQGNPLDPDTIICLCQHELGHKKHHHVTILNFIQLVGSLMPAVGAHILQEFPSVFAAVVGPHADVVPVVVYSMAELLTSILRSYLMPLKLALSHRFEYQADANIEEKYKLHSVKYLKNAFDDAEVTRIFRMLTMRHPSNADRAARMNVQI